MLLRISLSVISYRIALVNVAEIVVHQLVVLLRIWMTRRASARTGHVMSSPFRSWWMQTPFQPFFWLSSLSVALAAFIRFVSDADRDNCRSTPVSSFWKKVTSSILNCTVRLEFSRVAFVVYSPTRNR